MFVIVFLSISNKTFAYTLPTNNCTSNTATYDVSVVSQNDLNGNIPLCVIANANLPVSVYFNKAISENLIQTINSTGQTPFTWTKNFDVSEVGRQGGTPLHFLAIDNTGTLNSSSTADLTLNISPAPITLTNNKGLTDGGSYPLSYFATTSAQYPPQNVNFVTPGTAGSVQVSWTAPVSYTASFLGYDTDYDTVVSMTSPWPNNPASPRTVSGLTYGATYYFKVGGAYNSTVYFSDIYKVVLTSGGYVSSVTNMTNSLAFSCSNSQTMIYYPDASDITNNSTVDEDDTGSKNYSLYYTPSIALGTHMIECNNIGMTKTFTYTVTDPNVFKDVVPPS